MTNKVRFEKVARFADIEIDAPIRKTDKAACYDMVSAVDVIIPPYTSQMDKLIKAIAADRVTDEVQDMAKRVFDTQGQAAANSIIDSMITCTLDEMAAFTKATGAKPTLVSTGHKVYLEDDCSLDLYIRSSSPLKYWILMANSTGIIDADYVDNPDNEGEIFFQLINMSPVPIRIQKGEIIGQAKIVEFELTHDDEEQEKAKRVSGFGSTGTGLKKEENEKENEESNL